MKTPTVKAFVMIVAAGVAATLIADYVRGRINAQQLWQPQGSGDAAG